MLKSSEVMLISQGAYCITITNLDELVLGVSVSLAADVYLASGIIAVNRAATLHLHGKMCLRTLLDATHPHLDIELRHRNTVAHIYVYIKIYEEIANSNEIGQ